MRYALAALPVICLLALAMAIYPRDSVNSQTVDLKMHSERLSLGGGFVSPEAWAITVKNDDGTLTVVKCSEKVWKDLRVGDSVRLADAEYPNGTIGKIIVSDDPF